ncbi:hypothetical protein [Paremcibacter congregatus]|uniref:hypothetical protein n=1 Tax=Paremcibacter congregatus TaxID=2043170 RepID=UPI00111D78EA|nr:hypothetical protein [Paremcibacter congregatus]QDE27276.1 hypothetical protein FIV45_08250 [Paremcibacter congregatus]
MYKPKSWPHALIAAVVMAIFYYIVPPLPVVIYAALLPVVYYYGREVRDAEMGLGITSLSFIAPLLPWKWKDPDNRWDLYAPVITVLVFGFYLTYWKIGLIYAQ